MSEYSFVSPVLKRSTKDFPIYDKEKKIVGYMQRYYRNKWTFLLDAVFTNMFLNVKVQNKDRKMLADAVENVKLKHFYTFTRQSWSISSNEEGTFLMEDKSKIKTHPRYEFELNGEKYLLKKNLGDRKVYLYNAQEQLIAEATFDKITPPQEYTVKFSNSNLDHYTAICLIYTLILRD